VKTKFVFTASQQKRHSQAIPTANMKKKDKLELSEADIAALCEHLKANLADAQVTELHLADAITKQATQ